MSSIGRRLLADYWRLDEAFRSHPFSAAEAASTLSPPPGQRNLRLARLVKAGWLARLGRARYVTLGPLWARPGNEDGLAGLRHRSFYPELALATSQIVRTYGPRLRSLALFGSCARGDETPESDLDLLVVAEPLSRRLGVRLEESRPIAEALARFEREERSTGRRILLPQLVVLDLEEVRAEPPILLDMTQEARVIFDPERVLRNVLDRLAGHLQHLGSRRVRTPEGWSYWVLRPGARPGDPVLV